MISFIDKGIHFNILQLTQEHIQNYALLEIEKLLIQNGKSLRDFDTLPLPNMELLNQLTNSLIREETRYNEEELRKEYEKLFAGLNLDQQADYNAVMDSVLKKRRDYFLFMDMEELERPISTKQLLSVYVQRNI